MSEPADAIEAQGNGKSPDLPPFPKTSYSWYVVGVLFVIYIFSFMDRSILNLLVEPIKADLGISDTYMSYLMGFSFALFYAVFGLPLGRMADSMNRTRLIAVGLFLWTMATTGCGFARNYVQFLLLRFGVGVGEATLSPSAYSMITDYFPKAKLGRALSVYSMGISVGSGMALLVGGVVTAWAQSRGDIDLGFLGTIRPWQLVFLLIGLVGLTPLLLLLTVREPLRRGVAVRKAADGTETEVKVSLGEVLRYIGRNWKTVLTHHLGFAILSFSGYGAGAWGPAFMTRTHGWESGQIGLLFGLSGMIFGALGIVTGGVMTDWLLKRGRTDAAMRVGLAASILWVPAGLLYPLVPNEWAAWVLMWPATFFGAFPWGAAPAAVQHIMPNKMRGQASALYLFVVNLIGLGIGPSAVAWCTDFYFHDDLKLRYSLVVVGVVAHVIAIAAFSLGLKPFRESVERLKVWERENI